MSSLVYFAGTCGSVVLPLSMASDGAGAVQRIIQVRESQQGLDLGAILAQPFGAVLQFTNTGTERLLVIAATSGVTVQADVGAEVLGQAVTPFPAVTLTEGHLYAFGPFHSALQLPASNVIQVTLSSVTDVLAAVVQGPWSS